MRLGYIIMYVENIRSTIDFYEKAFGIKLNFIHESNTYAEMQTGETILAFVDEKMIKESHSFQENRIGKEAAGIEIAFVCEDVSHQFDRAMKAGAILVAKPKKKPWGQTICYIKDNNGCLIEICSPVEY